MTPWIRISEIGEPTVLGAIPGVIKLGLIIAAVLQQRRTQWNHLGKDHFRNDAVRFLFFNPNLRVPFSAAWRECALTIFQHPSNEIVSEVFGEHLRRIKLTGSPACLPVLHILRRFARTFFSGWPTRLHALRMMFVFLGDLGSHELQLD